MPVESHPLYDIHVPVITCHFPGLPDPSSLFGLLPPEGLVVRLDSDIIGTFALNKAKLLWKWFQIQCSNHVYTATNST